MYSIKKSVVFTAVLAGMIPLAPAPFVALIPAAVATGMGAIAAVVGAAGEVAGGVAEAVNAANGHGKLSRVEREPPDFPVTAQNELAWRICKEQLNGATVIFSGPAPGSVHVSGIPSACMTLLTVITGIFDEGDPLVEGTDSVLFTNLSNESIQKIQDALDAQTE